MKESGTIEAKTFKVLFNRIAAEKPLEIIAKDGKFYTVAAMTEVIGNQMKRKSPVFISNHLLDNAVDVRKATTDLDFLQKAAALFGGRVLVEGDHFHVELP